jgi:hypothetical protein
VINGNINMAKSKIQPLSCTVFIQIWVDVNMLATDNPEKGCYVVDNKNKYSEFEGSCQLQTNVVSGTKVCWSILPVDPQYRGKLTINSINVEFAYNDPPLPYNDSLDIWTGVVAISTSLRGIPKNLTFGYNNGSMSRSLTLPIAVNPVAQT